jgi:hypothetical protein
MVPVVVVQGRALNPHNQEILEHTDLVTQAVLGNLDRVLQTGLAEVEAVLARVAAQHLDHTVVTVA